MAFYNKNVQLVQSHLYDEQEHVLLIMYGHLSDLISEHNSSHYTQYVVLEIILLLVPLESMIPLHHQLTTSHFSRLQISTPFGVVHLLVRISTMRNLKDFFSLSRLFLLTFVITLDVSVATSSHNLVPYLYHNKYHHLQSRMSIIFLSFVAPYLFAL